MCAFISTIFSMEYPLILNRDIIFHIDYFFIFKDINKKNLKIFYKYYLNRFFDTFDKFEETLKEATIEDNTCLVIDFAVLKGDGIYKYKSNLEYINDEN